MNCGCRIEGPFVFDDFALPLTRTLIGEQAPRNVVAATHGAWTSFATTGDPAATGHVPTWPQYTTPVRPTMVFDDTTGVAEDPCSAGRAAWNDVDLRL
ncbi:hypothetical protein ACFTXO_24620 [Streptomyces sp. NPDC057067]|uniref:hypothetical protein n=1 Tax=unclassified Streptomyces TaxID=2593676 RepID=UPI003632E6AA